MRLFVAIDLSPEIKKTLISYMHDLKQKGIKGNYTPAQNLHLTLCFVGEVPTSDGVKAALKTVSYKPFKLALDETGRFGEIFWLGIKSNQKLKGLAADIRKAFDDAGIEYDKKPFEPHITLVRKVGGPTTGKIPVPRDDMMVKKVSLMKSEQKNGKMVYTEIFSF